MSDGLTPHEVRSYRRDGYLFPLPFLTPPSLQAAQLAIERLMSQCGHRARLPGTNLHFRWAYELASDPALLDRVESLLGPDILVWGTLILSKAPDSRGFVAWHQDSAYTDFLNGSPSLSAWVAMTPATKLNGCMRAIAGSHGNRLPFTTDRHPDEITVRGLRVLAAIDTENAVDIELQPGEASLHDISIIHGSDANQSVQPRTGFIVRYATPAMSDSGYPVQCVRGNAGNVKCVEPPLDDGPAAFRAYTEYLQLGN